MWSTEENNYTFDNKQDEKGKSNSKTHNNNMVLSYFIPVIKFCTPSKQLYILQWIHIYVKMSKE